MLFESFSLLITTPGPSWHFHPSQYTQKISSWKCKSRDEPCLIGWGVAEMKEFRPLCESGTRFGGITTSFVSHEFQLFTETCYGYPSMLNIFLPQRCNMIPTELQKTNTYRDTDWRWQHVLRSPSQHFLFVVVTADLVLGE